METRISSCGLWKPDYMFTGLVQAMGKIVGLQAVSGQTRFSILPNPPFKNLVDGESIAVNGVCLSVEKHEGPGFSVYASRETTQRTNIKFLANGAMVNLERALEFGERLGGHLVSGHVDCVARVASIQNAGESLAIRVSFPEQFSAEVISKGSVALNGISLTVNACGTGFLEVNIIPDSIKRTNIPDWREGTAVNMETDLIGKYVMNCLRYLKPDAGSSMVSGRIDLEFLGRNGFI